jgi:hypothetical protein
MWRFLLPAVVTMAVLIMLLAALGDLKSLSGRAVAVAEATTPNRISTAAPPNPVAHDAPTQQHRPEDAAAITAAAQAVSEQQAKREALQRQVVALQQQSADLQDQIAQRSTELEGRSRDVAVARAESDRLQRSIDALNGQQKSEEEILARLKAQEKQAATTTAVRRPVSRTLAPTTPQVPTLSSAQQLLAARQWLEAGRLDEARRMLATVQTQLVLQPVTPNRPSAEGNNPSATDVGNAIRWLDIGATGQAMQAIDRAVSDVQSSVVPDRQRPGYPPGPRPLYGGPGMPTDYMGNEMR